MWQARPYGSKLQSQQAGDMPQVWEARASQEGLARDSGQKTSVSQPVSWVQDKCEEEEDDIPPYHVRSHDAHRSPPIVVMVRVEDCHIEWN